MPGASETEIGAGAAAELATCPLGCGPLERAATVVRENRFGLDWRGHVLWCARCGLGVTGDRPTPAELEGLYRQLYTQGRRPGDEDVARVPRSGRVARAWHRLNGSIPLSDTTFRGPVLDVGAHTGELTSSIAARGVEVVALEPNPEAARIARSRGLSVLEQPIEDVRLPEAYFATAILSQVLEHVHDPLAVLRSIRRALRSDGMAYVVVPNALSAWRRLFGAHWIHWHVPFHLYHFTERSLRRLAVQAGFRVAVVRSTTPGEWVLMSFEAWRNARRGRYEVDHFSGRYVRRLLVAPPARLLDAVGAGDALVAELVAQ